MPATSITFNVEDLKTPDRLERVLRQFERAMQVTSTDTQKAVAAVATQVNQVAQSGIAASAPPPGLVPSVPLLSEDTHANRLANYPTPSTIGAQFFETDRTVLYIANTSLAWEYSAGTYLAAVASRPSDLGTNDAGFLFYATDQTMLYVWGGAAWTAVPGTLSAPQFTRLSLGGVSPTTWESFINTGVVTFTASYDSVAAMGSAPMLKLTNNNSSALGLYLADVTGGQRVYIWDPTQTMPNIVSTGIKPSFAVYGDVLLGDIDALGSNPLTLFRRPATGLSATAVTQFFSAQNNINDTDGGAGFILAPDQTGAVNSGYIRFVAYGQGTGSVANSILFAGRTGVNTFTDQIIINGTSGKFTTYAGATPTNGQILIGGTAAGNWTAGTLTGTSNQVTVTNGNNTITLSTPQDIATSSTPQFA